MKKVKTIYELFNLAKTDPRYAKLAVISANNLGGNVRENDLNGARNVLNMNANETDETGVVNEINFCIELVK